MAGLACTCVREREREPASTKVGSLCVNRPVQRTGCLLECLAALLSAKACPVFEHNTTTVHTTDLERERERAARERERERERERARERERERDSYYKSY